MRLFWSISKTFDDFFVMTIHFDSESYTLWNPFSLLNGITFVRNIEAELSLGVVPMKNICQIFSADAKQLSSSCCRIFLWASRTPRCYQSGAHSPAKLVSLTQLILCVEKWDMFTKQMISSQGFSMSVSLDTVFKWRTCDRQKSQRLFHGPVITRVFVKNQERMFWPLFVVVRWFLWGETINQHIDSL